jgi:hypothetical protein
MVLLQVIGGVFGVFIVAAITTYLVNAKHDRDQEIIDLHRLVSEQHRRQEEKIMEVERGVYMRIDEMQLQLDKVSCTKK